MNIYIPIEIKSRELESRTLLGLVAAERGHSVIVGSKEDTISAAMNEVLPPGIIHMKSITPHNEMIQTLTKLRSLGHRITVQDEEGGFIDETYNTFARLRFSEQTIGLVYKVFTWGEFDLNSLREIYPNQSDKFRLTGSPRADFWREDMKEYHTQLPMEEKFSEKKYIMVVSNFSGLMNVNRFWNIMARLREAGYFEREEGRERHEFENAAYQIQLIGEFVFMIRELSAAFSDMQIVFRPHPVETIEGWERLIGFVPNLTITREGSISRWIRRAELIIHNGCTSAIEAAIGGINRIAFRPLPHKIERAIPNHVSLNAFSTEELIGQVSELLSGKRFDQMFQNNEVAKKMIEKRIASTNGKFAADKIVEEWEKLAQFEEEIPKVTLESIQRRAVEVPVSTIQKLKKSIALVKLKMLNRQLKTKEPLLVSDHKFNRYSDSELEYIISSFRSQFNRFESVRYQRVSDKSFLFYS